MKLRTLLWIVLGVIVLHVAGFLLLTRTNLLPRRHAEPPPNFGVRQITYVNQKTGEKTVEKEFRVSTKLTPTTPEDKKPAP